MFARFFTGLRNHAAQTKPHHRKRPLRLESLETRTFMSATPFQAAVFHDAVKPAASIAASASLKTQFTVNDLKNAYGVSNLLFTRGGSTVAADGRGQTIAIIDENDDPNIGKEITTFDSAMGLPACNLTIAKENVNGKGPVYNAGWATEIAMDVELAHGFAPGANILLVEANALDSNGLYTMVGWARNQPGVSVMSMSWGADGENGGAGETGLDGYFVTPAGHTGITFVASAGDHGNPLYPACSPNVVSVGGTTLTMSGNSYYSETTWNDGRDSNGVLWTTGGGYSKYESKPAFQNGFVSGTMRGAVDVAMNAEPNTHIYTINANGTGSWGWWGGTSAAAPEFAAIIAIINQGRALGGLGTLSNTDKAIYSLPSSDFHDITTGNNTHYAAGPGWDPVTGRGSPIGLPFIRDMLGA